MIVKLLGKWVVIAVLCLAGAHVMAEDMTALLERCAPDVHPTTMGAIVHTESGGHQFALADAGPANLPWSKRKSMVRSFYPATADEAATTVHSLVKQGHIVAIGLAQVSSRNLSRFGLTVEDVLEPCANLAAGAQILTQFYLDAYRRYGDQDRALLAAISAYNTGDYVAGINNGYVSKVVAAGQGKVPSLQGGGRLMRVAANVSGRRTAAPQRRTTQDILAEAKNAPIGIRWEN